MPRSTSANQSVAASVVPPSLSSPGSMSSSQPSMPAGRSTRRRRSSASASPSNLIAFSSLVNGQPLPLPPRRSTVLPAKQCRHSPSCPASHRAAASSSIVQGPPHTLPTPTSDPDGSTNDKPSSMPSLFPGTPASDTALAALVEIQLEEASLEMVGSSHTSTHYSLPGRARVTFPALPASFGGRYRLLHGLTVTFEGKSEYWDTDGRYTPLRLHTTTIRLISRAYSIQPYCPDFGSITIDLPFDLRIPGWLPPTHLTQNTTVSYGVVSTATVGWANESIFSSFDFVSPMRHESGELALARTSRSAFNPVRIRRHCIPSVINEHVSMRQNVFRSKILPVEIMIKHAEVVDLLDPKGVKIDMHMRTSHQKLWDDHEREVSISHEPDCASGEDVEMSDSTARTAQRSSKGSKQDEPIAHVIYLAMNIEEREDVRSMPWHTFTSSYPLPAEQPTASGRYMLLGPSRAPPNPTPLFPDAVEPARRRYTRSCLLLPDGRPHRHVFANPLPITATTRRIKGALTMIDSGDSRSPRPGMSGPFVRVSHYLKTHVAFQLPSGEHVIETYRTPIRLVTSPDTFPHPRVSAPPPYIRMFHENGDMRDCDPLPLYSVSVPVDEDIEMVESMTAPEGEVQRSPTPFDPSNVPATPHASRPVVENTPPATPSPAPASLDGYDTEPSSSDVSPTPSPERPASSGSSTRSTRSTRSRSAADDLSPASRKLFEQWAREGSASAASEAEGEGDGELASSLP